MHRKGSGKANGPHSTGTIEPEAGTAFKLTPDDKLDTIESGVHQGCRADALCAKGDAPCCTDWRYGALRRDSCFGCGALRLSGAWASTKKKKRKNKSLIQAQKPHGTA